VKKVGFIVIAVNKGDMLIGWAQTDKAMVLIDKK